MGLGDISGRLITRRASIISNQSHVERGRFDGGGTRRTAALPLADAAALLGRVQAGEGAGQATTGFS